jgi:hypothetical protein
MRHYKGIDLKQLDDLGILQVLVVNINLKIVDVFRSKNVVTLR